MTRRTMLTVVAALAATSSGKAQPRSPAICDTHVHVLDPDRFPYSARRRYTPGQATVAQLREWHDRLGISRVVVVQNSVYGSDHRCLLDALRQLGPARARGVATIAATTTADEIAELDQAGVRGTRLNLEVGKDRNLAAAEMALREAAARMPQGWHVHVNAALPVIAGLAKSIDALSAPVVLDHFAHIEAGEALDQPVVETVLALLRARKVIVKLSGPYQVSKTEGYGDVGPIARALVAAAPGQVMWGSDWPHTGGANRPVDQPVEYVEPFRKEDDAANLALLDGWMSDPAGRNRILQETAAALYGFPKA